MRSFVSKPDETAARLTDAPTNEGVSIEGSEEMAVTRCICFDVTFERINELCDELGGLSAAHKECGFGARCGLCVPYALYANKNRETDLPVMWSTDFKKFGIPAPAIERLEAFLESMGEADRG
ncbi:MAG: hypothetical protein AAGI17_03625 [Planctomycetota bacterium]